MVLWPFLTLRKELGLHVLSFDYYHLLLGTNQGNAIAERSIWVLLVVVVQVCFPKQQEPLAKKNLATTTSRNQQPSGVVLLVLAKPRILHNDY